MNDHFNPIFKEILDKAIRRKPMISLRFKGFSIACRNPDCLLEVSVIDDIDGKLTEEDFEFCMRCGERLE